MLEMPQEGSSSIELVSAEEDGSEVLKATLYRPGCASPIKAAIVVFEGAITHVQKWVTSEWAAIKLPKGEETA